MPNLADNISHVFGDTLLITRTITGMSNGRTVTKAILNIKLNPNGDDLDDGESYVRKEITSASTAEGQITNPGSGSEPDRIAAVQFVLLPADTRPLLVLDGITYTWGIKVVLDSAVECSVFQGSFTGVHTVVNSIA